MEEPIRVQEARKRFRKLFPNGTKPNLSIYLNNRWRMALEKDPEGSQVLHFVEEMEELVRNTKRG